MHNSSPWNPESGNVTDREENAWPNLTESPAAGVIGDGRTAGSPASVIGDDLESPFTASKAVDMAIAGLDVWLETLRGPGGYGGPVAHWWQQSLMYTGAGLDWRYEGIITGYLNLWERTGNQTWLGKARRAGDDLASRQFPDGHYPASSFELNPATGGTPHEASCDAGLLLLARSLRAANQAGWEKYAECAELNLRRYYVERLWDAEAQAFGDNVDVRSFVPNKAATVCEALFLMSEISGDAVWVERYAVPTLKVVLGHQVRHGGPLYGAIAQGSFGGRRVEKYFPFYIARCVPALLEAHRWTGSDRYLDAALQAMRFVARWTRADGSLPTVVYNNERFNLYPSWVAPLGDVLRAADALRPFGFEADFRSIERRLLAGRDESGGIQTAVGFAAQVGGSPSGEPDVRDVLHVAGWCDKAFRYLTAHGGPEVPALESRAFEAACVFQGKAMWLSETPEVLEITTHGGVCYRWRKGQAWPEVASPEFWLR
jgi:hypothetical protein